MQKAGPLQKLEKGAIGAKWTTKWVVCDHESIQYFASDKAPKRGENPRKRFELTDLQLRAQPAQVGALAGKRAALSFQLLERTSKYMITFACASPAAWLVGGRAPPHGKIRT